MQVWEILLDRARRVLLSAGIGEGQWRFGGGTVLMLRYAHRLSKDADIFFSDPQLLAYVSPRVNDALEDELGDYAEQSNYIRLVFEEGKVDFIVARQQTALPPERFRLASGLEIFVDQPMEIIAKKIFYRSDEFRPRDVFDMAVVVNREPGALAVCPHLIAEHAPTLLARLDRLEAGGVLREAVRELAILPGFEGIRDDCGEIVRTALVEFMPKSHI